MRWLINLMVTSFLFFPEKGFYAVPADLGLSSEDVFFSTGDGVRLHGWFFESSPVGASRQVVHVLLFLHGNAGNISGRLLKAREWVKRGVSVFLVDYRSYGKSGGKIGKGADLLEDARSALRWLEGEKKIPSGQIILYGESLGSYPAIHLALEKKFAGLVLEAPFATLLELARKHYPWVPETFLKDFVMDNQAAISSVRAPVFILHGDRDEICPIEQGERLYEMAPSPKEFQKVPGANHNDLPEVLGNAYVENCYRFLAAENGFS